MGTSCFEIFNFLVGDAWSEIFTFPLSVASQREVLGISIIVGRVAHQCKSLSIAYT
jgi:hypothetical protein